MKKIIYNLFLLCFLCVVSASAQEVNKLVGGDATCMKSVSVDMPFYLENTNPGVVALQFEVTVPAGVSISTDASTAKMDLTRTIDHRARIASLGSQTYRVMVMSPTNKPFKANRGKVFSLKTSVATDAALTEGDTYPVTIRNVIVSDSLGHNVMTAFADGSITLETCPDFTVSSIAVTSGDVQPGGKVSLTWDVINKGARDSQGGWSEQISLVSNQTGETLNLTTMHNTTPLAAGATMQRSAEVVVPRVTGISGDFKARIKIVPNSDSGESVEYQGNNTGTSTDSYTMQKMLYLTQNNTMLTETNGDRTYTCYLERSGSKASAETFTLTKAAGDARIVLPQTVTISRYNSSAYFYLTVKGDNQLNGDTVAYAISVPAQNGYEAVSSSGKLIDDELRSLMLTPSKTSIDEGETFLLTITTNQARQEDVPIKLSCERASRFSFPSTVVLPLGETSVTVEVKATDDNVINLQEGVVFTASASRYYQGQTEIIVGDNDMPTLSMTLSPTTISEASGPQAIRGVILRSGQTNGAVTIRLSDDGGANMYYATRTISLSKGQTRAEFTMGVVDDGLVNGDRDVQITAAVYVSSCNCIAGQTTGGVMTETIHVIDNDGPSLSLSSDNANMLEGSTDNRFTVSTNTSALENPLIVNISSTHDGDVDYPHTVTIPAGSRSASFMVDVPRNDVQGDSRRITFAVQAEGYSKAFCTVMATDQTLPDASITALRILSQNIAVGEKAVVETDILNSGYDVLPKNTPIMFSHGTRRDTYYLKQDVAPGEQITQQDTLITMAVAGTYTLQATIDPINAVREIDDMNNDAQAIELVIMPLFSATATTDKSRYLNTETVTISGHATGINPNNADVEVYVICGSTRYVVKGKTDSDGNYSVEWKPEGNIAGHFIVGACTPDEGLRTEKACFEMYGMRRFDTGFILKEMEVGEEVTGYVDITNHGTLKLNNITVAAVDMPTSASITTQGIGSLMPGSHERVYFTLKGLQPSTGRDWETVKLHIESGEGAQYDQTVYFFVYSAKPALKASISTLNTTMTKGKTRTCQFTLRNDGRQETGDITLDLGNLNWLRAATPTRMASLKTGEEATVVLQLTPSPDMQLNSIITGSFAINCANGSGVSIPLRIETVSEETGTMVIDVWDEFTMNTEEAPHVEGATVSVLHPVTGRLIRQAVSDVDGLVTFEQVPEGTYNVKVTHPKHSSWQGSVTVNPARTTTQRVFIQYSAITVEMKYEKTEIEDEYNIVTTVTYETNVPKPVVTIDMPDKIILDEIETPYIFYAYMSNHGLVTAFDATFHLPAEANGYTFTPLVEGPWDILPNQTVTIPVEINKKSGESSDSRVSGPMYLGKPAKSGETSVTRRSNAFTDFACGILALGNFFIRCDAQVAGGMNSVENEIKKAMQIQAACGGATDLPGGGGASDPDGKPAPPTGNTYEDSFASWTNTQNGTTGGGTSVTCDPFLTKYGPVLIKTLASAACPVISWGFNLTDLLDGDPWGMILSLAGTAVKAGTALKASEMSAYVDPAIDAGLTIHFMNDAGDGETFLPNTGGGNTPIVVDDDDAISDWDKWWNNDDDEDDEIVINTGGIIDGGDDNTPSELSRSNRRSTRYNYFLYEREALYIYTDTEGKEHKVRYPKLMRYVSKQISKLYFYMARGAERTQATYHLPEPVLFSDRFYSLEKPEDLGDVENPEWYPSAMRAWSDRTTLSYYNAYHSLVILNEMFGDWSFMFYTKDQLQALTDTLTVLASDPTRQFNNNDTNEQTPIPVPESLTKGSQAPYHHIIQRFYNTLRRNRGEALPEGEDNYIHEDVLRNCLENSMVALREVNRMGYDDESQLLSSENKKLLDYLQNPRNSVCSKVKLQLEQKLTMTRQAVRGTLTVVNGSENQPMKDVKLHLVVTNPDGNVADSHIMEITTESINGFTGQPNYESGWELGATQTGVAKILFIPTRYAAPDEPVQYTFAGTISFIDPFTNLPVSRDLEVERLTVTPSPVLDLTYFMQRDVLGDDALTKDVVEAVVPSQFSLLINNKGKGDATKVRMLTNQPEIIDNEKGLLVDFEIISSQLNGGDKTLAMGQSVATDFGTIKAGKSALAQWWLTSSLTGHFVDYNVEATHVTSYDNPDLSLLDQVTIHEMIHQVAMPGVSTLPESIAFLVNDEEDYNDYPDQLYTMDGEKTPVAEATSATCTKLDVNRYRLNVQPLANGWNYGNVTDPTGGTQTIKSVKRESDNTLLPTDNFWQTDRTLVDMMEPVYENLIHYADQMAITGETYIIEFEPKPVDPLVVASFSGIPVNEAFTRTPVGEVTFSFNRTIDEATLTTDDLTLTREGEPVDMSGLGIVKVNDQTFQIDLSSLTTLDGYYVLTVQTAGVTDAEGINGTEGKKIGWTQIEDGKATLTMKVEPAGAGIVTPGTSKQDYFGEVMLTATANEGYRFSGWKEDSEAIASETTCQYSMFGPKTVTAVFTPQQYLLGVNWNKNRGSVTGGGTGQYDYNTEVTLMAEPKDGCFFKGWRHGNEATLLSTEPTLTFTVKGADTYEAVFEQVKYVDVMLDEDAIDNTSVFDDAHGKYFMVSSNRQLKSWQWNPVCLPFDLSEQQINKLWGYATMIVRFTSVTEDHAMNFDYQYEMKAGVPYLIKPERTVSVPQFEFNGDNIKVVEEPLADEHNGYSFVGNYTPHTWDVNRADGVEYYYGVSSNKIIKAKATTSALKGLRAYFVLPNGANARMVIGGVETGIEDVIDGNAILDPVRVYNLQGQYLGSDADALPRGLYIINGKKQVIR